MDPLIDFQEQCLGGHGGAAQAYGEVQHFISLKVTLIDVMYVALKRGVQHL